MTAEDFKAILREIGITHDEAAEALDIDARTVRRYAYGQTPVPRPVELALAFLAERDRARYFSKRFL